MQQYRLILLCITIFALIGCSNTGSDEPLIQVATSEAPGGNFVNYRHQSGVFSIRVPQNWVPNELPDDNGVRIEFSTLEGTSSIVRLTVYIVNTGAAMTREAFLQTTNAYAPPTDFANYNWRTLEDPVDQADGSRRVVGIRDYPIIGSRVLNVFMQPNGRYFSVLEADVTDASPTTLDTLTAVVNTFQITDSVSIEQGEVVGGVTYVGNVGFEAYQHWSDVDGGFNITGLVVNNQDIALEAVRLSGYLFDARGNQLGDESLILSQDVLQPGEKAPFRMRFEAGRPSSAVRYELHAAARVADFSLNSFYGNDNFEITGSSADINASGNVVVSGQFINRGDRLVRNPRVIVAIYDSTGNVVASESQFTGKSQLLPAEIDGFDVIVSDLGGEAIRFEVSIVGTAE